VGTGQRIFHVSDWQRHVGGPNDHGAVLRFTDPLFEFIDALINTALFDLQVGKVGLCFCNEVFAGLGAFCKFP
jgi:hypothetical protein